MPKQYKYTSDQLTDLVQLDSVLTQMGQRAREGGSKWECEVTKDDAGGVSMALRIAPKPKLPDLADKAGPLPAMAPPAATPAVVKPVLSTNQTKSPG